MTVLLSWRMVFGARSYLRARDALLYVHAALFPAFFAFMGYSGMLPKAYWLRCVAVGCIATGGHSTDRVGNCSVQVWEWHRPQRGSGLLVDC